MENDEKTPSRGDETLPTNDDEQPSLDGAREDELAAEAPHQPEKTESHSSSNTLVFPGSSRRRDEPFGVPGFLPDPESADSPEDLKSLAREDLQTPELLTIEAEEGLPLSEDTGWESGGSIIKPSSLRARIEMQDADEELFAEQLFASEEASAEETKAAPRHEANVTPFPGVLHRLAEPAPAEMLRGAATSANVFEEISAQASEDQATPDTVEEPANQDALADAVQSALRNIYGGYSEAQEEMVDLGSYTVADALAGAEAAAQQAVWSEDGATAAGNWRAGRAQDFDTENDEAEELEGALDYLYNKRRLQGPAPEMSLSDYAARAASLGDVWQPELEEEEESEQRVTPFPIRERADVQRARAGSDFLSSAEPSILRGGYFPEEDGPATPSLETGWGQQPYATPQNARGNITPTFAPTISSSPEQLSAAGPDSGHLLGAAGLGLIGGIALAGVLAVFVFNSFVDESGQSIPDSGGKVVERLANPQPPASPPDTRSTTENRTDALPPVQSAATAAPTPEPPSSSSAAEPQSPASKLTVSAASGTPDTPIKLNIALANGDVGDALVSLKGLPKDAKLSTGIDVGGGQWLLPPGRLKDLTVTARGSAAGNYQLEAQLLKDDAQTSLSDAVPFTLSITTPSPKAAAGQPAANAAAGNAKPDVSRLALLPDEAPLPETDFLTQMLIRDGNKKMRDGDIAGARRLYEQAAQSGNAEAALAMGRSYDPTYFEKLNVKTGKPDPATAFEWYKRALDGGLVTAKVKIDALKQWLQK